MNVAVGIGVAVVVLALFFVPFFGSAAGFWGAVRFLVTPDVLSIFRGEWEEDQWQSVKLLIWVIIGVGAGFSAAAMVG